MMIGSFLVMLFFTLQVRFEEDITHFFPDTEEARNTEIVFGNLRVKDKIILMLSSKETDSEGVSPKELIHVGDELKDALMEDMNNQYFKNILSKIDAAKMEEVSGFIYANLPIFLSDEAFARLDSLTTPEAIDSRMRNNMRYMLLPMSGGLKQFIPNDPLGIGVGSLEMLRDFQLTDNYTIYNDHIFSKDTSTLLIFVTPVYGMGATGKNEHLIDALEDCLTSFQSAYPSIHMEYFGGPSVSVYNARQIKRDTTITLGIALLIIIVFITLVFRSRSAVLLIILPVIYGVVFSLALICILKGSVSAIAIGAGAAIFGVALSYSIHILSHFNHVTSIRQLIEELAYPMTIGSFTTVGAFFGLLFTSSALLRDFGLFSALSLIGTTFFCLVFLPHLLHVKRTKESGRVLRFIEKINSYAYDRNKPLVIGIVIVFIICLFLVPKVKFDSNMMNLGYEPKHIKAAEKHLTDLFDKDNRTTLFVSVGRTTDEGLQTYANTNKELIKLKEEGLISEYASAERIIIPFSEQERRINRWNDFWASDRRKEVTDAINASAVAYGFRDGAFDPFFQLIDKSYQPVSFPTPESMSLFEDWTATADSLSMYITQVRLKEENKQEVYNRFMDNKNMVIFDRGYFANRWVSAINDDFDLVLYICSFLVFFALLISYGRIELTLMTFAPMAISWVIILGIMVIGGIQFNIVNIILATFIFGLGDDFAIFIMDGLQQKYRTGKQLLTSHKTAIFFSSFTSVVGLGVLIFAKHPALQSISLISLLGMVSVVLVSYTILPLLFRIFISDPAKKGNYPHTAMGLFTSFWFYNAFIVGCSLVIGVASLLIPLPMKRERKKQLISKSMMYMLRGFLKCAWLVRQRLDNPSNEDFSKPAVVVANHQSFIDILILLSLSPKFVMVTANWVWTSPLIGRIARTADFINVRDGYETAIEHLRRKVALGYSVVVFPEGTRSADLTVHRFHKGAFYMAEQLGLDIVPIVLYGTGMVLPKKEPSRIKKGVMITHILPRISLSETTMGDTYQVRTKTIGALVRNTYNKIRETENNPDNPYFYQKLITNYIYKGPIEEWYLRVKVRMEDNYRFFHERISPNARITDIGCGYGALAYMLNMYAGERKILGIDYDADKIAVANHNFSRNDNVSFTSGNALEVELPESDVFILNDILHYMDYTSQEKLITRCKGKLTDDGCIIIRDSNTSDVKHHILTRFTELLSTRLTGFNKTAGNLYFPSTEQFHSIAKKNRMLLEECPNDKYTSNTIYILKFT